MSPAKALLDRLTSDKTAPVQEKKSCNLFFFFSAGAFLQQQAPNGQTWEEYCGVAELIINTEQELSDNGVSGPWAECMHAAVAYEKLNPKWKEDAAYADAQPTQQVIDYFEACGHSELTPNLEEAMKRMCDDLMSNTRRQ
jgi:hypothetical protein